MIRSIDIRVIFNGDALNSLRECVEFTGDVKFSAIQIRDRIQGAVRDCLWAVSDETLERMMNRKGGE